MQGRRKASLKQANGRRGWANSLCSYLFLWDVVTSAQIAKRIESLHVTAVKGKQKLVESKAKHVKSKQTLVQGTQGAKHVKDVSKSKQTGGGGGTDLPSESTPPLCAPTETPAALTL